jgi:hypothetical protein
LLPHLGTYLDDVDIRLSDLTRTGHSRDDKAAEA